MYTSSGNQNCKRQAKLAGCKNVKTQHCICCAFDARVYEQRFWIDDSSPLREPGHECARQRQRLDAANNSGQHNPKPKTSVTEAVEQSALKSKTFTIAHNKAGTIHARCGSGTVSREQQPIQCEHTVLPLHTDVLDRCLRIGHAMPSTENSTEAQGNTSPTLG